MKTNGSFYAKRRPNSCSVLFLKDIIVLFKHSFMHQIFIEPVPYGKISADILLNKRDMVWALNYEFKSTEKNWQ